MSWEVLQETVMCCAHLSTEHEQIRIDVAIVDDSSSGVDDSNGQDEQTRYHGTLI